MKRFFFLAVFALVFLAGCESQTRRDTDGLENIIPTKEKDSGPTKPVDVSNVPDAVPKVEPRTIAGNKSPYKVKGIVYRVMQEGKGYQEEGIASWYGRKFHGNTTSNGEIYDMYGMTGAHKSLPIPSYVKVENLENKKSIVVRINDRGPFAPGRIIDLSYAGAQKLGYADTGTARVRVTYIDASENESSETGKEKASSTVSQELAHDDVLQNSGLSFKAESSGDLSERELFLQTGAFSKLDLAMKEKRTMEQYTNWPITIEKGLNANRIEIHRVHIGPLPDQETLETLQRALVQEGLREPVRVFKP